MRQRVARRVPELWSLGLALLLLGPALAPGFVLSYDMVWVPDLALRPDVLGLGSGLPRAVPSDGVVAVLDEVVPGMLLQKLVLLGSLTAAGCGAAALTATLSTPARCAAASVYLWSPFLVERLVIGHWPVLVGYAVLPWLILAASRRRRTGRLPAAIWLLLPLGCLSAGAALVSTVAVLAFGLRRGGHTHLGLLAAVALANAPWVVAGLLHVGVATSDPAGAEVFALRAEGLSPAPLAALGLGGIWNTEVVPVSRTGLLALLSLAVLALLSLAGVAGWRRALPARDRAAYLLCWGTGLVLAVGGWAAVDLVGWLAARAPGGGLLRDGSRFLALCAPLLAVLVGFGVERVRSWLGYRSHGLVVACLLVLVPVAFMPDAGWGSSGRLRAVAYPQAYEQARDVVGDADRSDVLLLPFSSYRAPAWNGGRKVLDPLGRYLRPDYVASDELVVSERRVAGEDPRGASVRRALAAPTPAERAHQLGELGVGVVVTDRAAPGRAPRVAGRVLLRGDELVVVRLPAARAIPDPTAWVVVLALAWGAYLASFVIGLTAALLGLWARRRAKSAGQGPRPVTVCPGLGREHTWEASSE